MNAKNQATTLFELGPREALTQGLKTLGERLAQRSQGLARPSAHWLSRFWGAK